jgi:lipoate-protein ligase B
MGRHTPEHPTPVTARAGPVKGVIGRPCYRRPVDATAIRAQSESRREAAPAPLHATWLGRVPYREAWDLQRRLAARRADDAIPDQLLLLEHPAVLTLGRHADEAHVLAPRDELERRGIEVLRVERGGEVTYHGPGQLVAYPILRLDRRGLLLRPLVRALEGAMADACRAFGVEADRRDGHPGCWCDPDGDRPRKIGALGIRVERGVTYHGIALNVAPDLDDFGLIDACGMPGTVSTALAAEAGEAPSVHLVAQAFAAALGDRLPAALSGDLESSSADGRRRLERLAELG